MNREILLVRTVMLNYNQKRSPRYELEAVCSFSRVEFMNDKMSCITCNMVPQEGGFHHHEM